MPRDGSGNFTLPAGTDGVPGTTIESAPYNAMTADFELDANTPRPIVAGGTGSGTASGALTNLGALAKTQNLNDVTDKPTAWSNIKQSASTTVEGAIRIANNAEMIAAASASIAVPPGGMRQHPGVVKFWVQANTSGGIYANHNVSSVTDAGTGLITVNLSLGFVNTSNMCCAGMAIGSTNIIHAGTLNASSIPFGSRDIAGALSDPVGWWVMGVGNF